jgi:hypothetical protein
MLAYIDKLYYEGVKIENNLLVGNSLDKIINNDLESISCH